MRTITQNTAGGPEVLVIVEIDDPTPGPGEVLVRVSAAGINPVDAAVRAGYYPLLGNPPFTVGWDISGTVEAIGPGVSEFAVGDEVFGMPRFPEQAAAYAEKVVAPAGRTGAQAGEPRPCSGRRIAVSRSHRLARPGQDRRPEARTACADPCRGRRRRPSRRADRQGTRRPCRGDSQHRKARFRRGLGADEVIDYTKSRFHRETARHRHRTRPDRRRPCPEDAEVAEIRRRADLASRRQRSGEGRSQPARHQARTDFGQAGPWTGLSNWRGWPTPTSWRCMWRAHSRSPRQARRRLSLLPSPGARSR